MIVSHKHQFIFLKTTKTAGTSIEIALSQYCGDLDVLSPLWPDEEEMRLAVSGRTAQNFELPLTAYSAWERLRIRLGKKQQHFYNHCRACEVRPRLTPAQWNSYYKFAFTRNPWDRVVSHYFFHNREGRQVSLKDYINPTKLQRLNKRGWGLYTIDGKLAVDRVCRYENLEQELEAVEKTIGLPGPIALPKAKTEYRRDQRHYRDILSQEQGALIARIFRPEIDHFGYRF